MIHAALTLASTVALLATEPDAPGTPGGPGLAVFAEKVLTCVYEGPQVVDHAVVLVRDGRFERVGRRSDIEVPEGYHTLDLGEHWLAPGMIDLHCHESGLPLFGGFNDINDMVYLTNPGLRVSPGVIPQNPAMRAGIAGGVTSVLFIPGSGTNIGGQGVLLKTALPTYEENLIRDPGSMKLAQWGNPESWTIGVGMSFENWSTRNTIRRGLGYARSWSNHEGDVPAEERDIQFDIFRDLLAGEVAISTHTQLYQVVLMTLTMIGGEFGLPVFLDHSTVGGWLTGAIAAEMDIPAIIGPRSVDTPNRGFIEWARNKHEGFRGIAAGYQQRGMKDIGFNTDTPIIPQQELSVNAAMGVRYGMDDSGLESVRGLTIVPAKAAKIDHLVGSIEAGKEADFIVTTGHPADPRTAMDLVFIEGHRVYDAKRDGRKW